MVHAAWLRRRRAVVALFGYFIAVATTPSLWAQDCGIVGCGDPVCDSVGACCASSACGGGERFWLRGEYLYWQVTGAEAPPLVTSSPEGTPLTQAGRLGNPSTTVLVGGDELTDSWRSGFAVSGGFWIDPCCGLAVVGDYFHTGQDGFNSSIGPDSNVIFTRPYFNSQTGAQDTELVNVPDELEGNVHVQSESEFQGAGLGLEKCLWNCCDPCACGRSGWISLVGGYRYYQHNSLLKINEDLLVLPGTSSPLVPGTTIDVEDKFGARNQFHGGEIGLQARVQQDFLWLDGLAAVAVGGNRRDVSINGGTSNTVPNSGFSSSAGGLLTSSATNIGNYQDVKASVVPRFRLGLGCQISQRWSARVGYNVIIWHDVVQAASELPSQLAVDPRNIPPVQAGGGPQPAFPGFFGTTVVAHGMDAGLEYAF